MSARSHSARQSAASTFSYAEAPSSSDEDTASESDEDGRGGGGRSSKSKAPTKRTKAKGKATEVDSRDESDEYKTPRKKARQSLKAKQRKQKKPMGKFFVLGRLPLEMIHEIFSHLDPDDLLALSMVNKQYRALLLAKSSARAWKVARDRLGMPDSTAGGFTEWQYAQLTFGKKCQECGRSKTARPDFGIRKRLCKDCRMSRIVRLLKNWKKHRIPGLHPLARRCVVRPLHSPIMLDSLAYIDYALEADLRYWSGRLWELEDADTDSEASESDDEPPATTSSSARPARSTRRTHTSTQPSYKEDSPDEDDDVGMKKTSRRVAAFVAARQPLVDLIESEGKKIFRASKSVREKVRARKVERVSSDDRMAQLDRADEIAERMLELDPTCGACVDSVTFSCHKLVKRKEPLTDAEWMRIKPAILRLVARIKKKQRRAAMHVRLRNRQRSLRPRYDELKASLPTSARPFMPLFIDFLVLSSVKALWQDEAVKLDDDTWEEHLDDVKEELDQYRLDLVLHARDLIISARADPDDGITPSGELDDVEDMDLSDDFFNLVTSFVCCSFTDCEYASIDHERMEYDRVANVFGPLERVVQHQHEFHNNADALAGGRAFRNEPQLRIVLPLEVVCVLDAVMDLAKLDPSDAASDDLVRFNRIVEMYEWENSVSPRRRTMWNLRKLLLVVKSEVQSAAAAKPPYSLEPPVIRCYLADPRDWDKLPLPKVPVDLDKNKKRRATSSTTSSDDSDDDSDDDDDNDNNDNDGEPAVRNEVVIKEEEMDEFISESEEES